MFKNLLQSGIGTKLSLVGAILSIITVILYPIFYASKLDMNWLVFVFSLLAVVAVAIGIFLKKLAIAQIATFVLSLLALTFFIISVWDYFFDFLVGIDVRSLSAGFIISFILLVIQLIISILASIFVNESSKEEVVA